ncbi:MAG: cell division protein FtsQ/DivIB [Xanthomonadales bacterium]|nr:cell division protein FtsQ/DivIB [Xanthomonadales bacterium]
MPNCSSSCASPSPLFGGAGSVRALGRRGHGGWHLTLADGFRIELGREQPRERLARFARLRPRLLRHPAGTLRRRRSPLRPRLRAAARRRLRPPSRPEDA